MRRDPRSSPSAGRRPRPRRHREHHAGGRRRRFPIKRIVGDRSRSMPTASPTATTSVACALLWRQAGAAHWRDTPMAAARQRPLARRVRGRRDRPLGIHACAPGSIRSCRGAATSRAGSTPTTCAIAARSGAELIAEAAQRARQRRRCASCCAPGRAELAARRAPAPTWRDCRRSVSTRRARAIAAALPRSAPRARRCADAGRHGRAPARPLLEPGTSSSRARPPTSRRATAPSPTARPGCPTSARWASTSSTSRRSIRSGARAARAATTRSTPRPTMSAARGRSAPPKAATTAILPRARHAGATSGAWCGAPPSIGIEIALDIAFQCSPDHPGCSEHPEWFRKRADGSIQYAENPPKKYQDIYPFDFETRALARAVAGARRRVRVLGRAGRAHLPRRQPAHQGVRVLGVGDRARSSAVQPDVIFLCEAFTRPKVMHRLAKLGFSQSYTYFTWRNTKQELTEYFTELSQGPGASTSGRTCGRTRPTSCPRRCSSAARGVHGAARARRDAGRELRHLRAGLRAARRARLRSRQRGISRLGEVSSCAIWDRDRPEVAGRLHRACSTARGATTRPCRATPGCASCRSTTSS